MEQHPLPQDITAYRFRLVGSMTLKQFLELASGIVLAWVIFNSNLNFLIRWPLAPMTAFFGFALAFIPLEDRPLDQWIINFFKAIYQPTQFLYKQLPRQIAFLAPSTAKAAPSNTGDQIHPEQLADYLKTLPGSPTTAFDAAEQKYLDYIHSLFGALGNKITLKLDKDTAQPPAPVKSVRGVRVRKLLHPQMCLLPHAALYQAPAESAVAAMPQPVQPKPAPVKPVAAPAPPPAKVVTKPTPFVKPATPQASVTTAAVFAKGLVLPQSPEKPNLIAGITLDEKGKILTNVILEIKDNQGLPVRALKSNKLGQFFIATPLEDGIYQIAAEHPDKRFAIIKLEAKGEIIPPLKIQAQG